MINNTTINIISNHHFNFGVNNTPSLSYRIVTFPYDMIATPIGYTWNMVKSIFKTRSQMCKDISALASSMDGNHNWTETEKELVINAINSMDYVHMKKDLAQIFKKSSQPVVEEIIKKGIEQGLQQDKQQLNLRPFDLMDHARLLELSRTNPEKLTEEIGVHADLVKDSLRNPLADIVAAKYRKLIPTVVHYFHRVIEILIKAFGLESLDNALENGYPIDWILDILKNIVIMPVVLSGLLVPLMGFWPALGATAAILTVAIIVASIYVEYFRPCPEKIASGDNMTLLAKRGEYEPVVAREKEIEDLINALSSHERAIIVGPTGVGKTELVKLLAQRIASDNVPEFLKGKVLFQLNTAEFSGVMGIQKLREIQNALEGYEKQVILFFDEIHVACKPENKNLGDFLKTFSQRYMTIAATTDKEYQHVTTDGAFSGRFSKVDVTPTNEEQTETVVFEYFRRLLPNVEISSEHVQLIVRLTNELTVGRNQPDRAKNAVYGIVARLQNNIPRILNEQKAQLLREMGLLEKQFSLGSEAVINDPVSAKYAHLKGALKEVDSKIAAQMEKIKKINLLQTLRRQVRFDNHEMAVEMAEGRVPPRQLNEMKAKWLIENRFVLPVLTELMKTKANAIPETTVRVTEQLVREVVDAMRGGSPVNTAPT